MNYSEKLKDPRWQRKRLEILERDGWGCRHCGDQKSTLHVHHLFYINGRHPWEYLNGAFITLCEECHAEIPEEMEDQRKVCDENPGLYDTLRFDDWEHLQDVGERLALPVEVFLTAIAPLLELGRTCHIVRTHDLLRDAITRVVAQLLKENEEDK